MLWSRPRLRRALQRVNTGTVMISEYPVTPRVRWGWGRPPLAMLDHRFAAARDDYARLLTGFGSHLPALRAIPKVSPDARQPQWDNEFFGGLDSVALYAFLADRKPARYLEVGSGHSTRFARRAIRDQALATTITSIDPAPRAEIDALCDTVHRTGLQDAPADLFDELESGDVLLIDGSHMALMDSDAVVLFTELLPRLAPGVLVGIDDVFLPWDYPPTWVDRWYGEQYLLAMMLIAGDPSWEVRLPTWWVSNDEQLADAVAGFTDPADTAAGTVGVTFWMERTASLPPTSVT